MTDPTSPRTSTVTSPASTISHPTIVTCAAFTMASDASISPTRPRVSIMPSASPTSSVRAAAAAHIKAVIDAAVLLEVEIVGTLFCSEERILG